MTLYKLRGHPEWAERAARWFYEKWGIPLDAYKDSIAACLKDEASVPQWYIMTDGGEICAGAGVIENDFHDRKDLFPNVCAVYVEPLYRGRGVARGLLDAVCRDMAGLGVDTLYLLTDHVGFYERCGWRFLCMAQGEGDDRPSRIYAHQMNGWNFMNPA